jgi:hypothetical protein
MLRRRMLVNHGVGTTEHHQRAREGCARFRPSKFQPPSNEADMSLHGVIVPPPRIGPRRDKAGHRRPALRFLVGFPHPITNHAPIRRVHPATARCPLLAQAILLRREKLRALRVLRRGAYIQRERPELRIGLVEKVLRSEPFDGARHEMHRAIRSANNRFDGTSHKVPRPSILGLALSNSPVAIRSSISATTASCWAFALSSASISAMHHGAAKLTSRLTSASK